MYINFRLITTSENLLNTRNMTNRKLTTNVIEGFTSAKKLFKKLNFRNILIENKLPSPSKIIEKPKEVHIYVI